MKTTEITRKVKNVITNQKTIKQQLKKCLTFVPGHSSKKNRYSSNSDAILIDKNFM